MGDLDVRALAGESLPEDSFPVSPQTDFRLYLAPEVHSGISQHARSDTSIEICGVLVGHWRRDTNGPYATVEDHIFCESATSKFAEVTFTHESWAQINREMDTRFQQKRIVGWYHSHPDFGIFLSDRDCFIHEHFFSGAGQVAYVVDPVRDLEGMFAWKDGKPTVMPHYWIGSTIRTMQASTSSAESGGEKRTAAEGASSGAGTTGRLFAESRGFSLATLLLSLFVLFLLGYQLAGCQSSWERRAIIDGVVSNYTNFKLVKIGLRDELAAVRKYLSATAKELGEVSPPGEAPSAEQQEELANRRKAIVASLLTIQHRLLEISDRYGFSDEEHRAMAQVQAQLMAQERQLRKQREAQADAAQPLISDEDGTSETAANPTKTETPADSETAAPAVQTDVLEERLPTESSQDPVER